MHVCDKPQTNTQISLHVQFHSTIAEDYSGVIFLCALENNVVIILFILNIKTILSVLWFLLHT